jgi:hypothetical protein
MIKNLKYKNSLKGKNSKPKKMLELAHPSLCLP